MPSIVSALTRAVGSQARTRYLLAAVITVVASGMATAQEIGGDIEATLVDSSGQPVPAVNVTVRGPALIGTRTGVSLETGLFRISAIPVGEYAITLSRAGYQTVTVDGVQVRLGHTTALGRIVLEDGALDMEAVLVTAPPLVIDPVSTEVATSLPRSTIDALPTERDYRAIVSYTPFANTSYLGDGISVAGSSGFENYYSIDGVNVTDPRFGSAGTRLPQNFIREIQVKAGGYEAEFGRSSGAVINVVTHSGSNEFEGSVYGYFSNNDFSSSVRRGFLELPLEEFQRYDLGFNVGGPIVRDKLWFFAAYDPSFEREELEFAGLAHRFEDDLTTHQFAGKLSWQASEATRFDLLTFGDPTSSGERIGEIISDGTFPSSLTNPDPILGLWKSGGYVTALNGQHLIGDGAVLELSASWLENELSKEPATQVGRDEPQFRDFLTGVWEGGFGGEERTAETRRAVKLVGTVFQGAHEIKIGAEYEQNDQSFESRWQTTDGGDGLIWRTGESEFYSNLVSFDADYGTRNPSAFVQDTWSVTDRLRVNLGVRWDGLYVVDENDEDVFQITDQIAPRVGLAYSPGALGTQKIFGSFGRFYEQTPLEWVPFTWTEAGQRTDVYDTDPRQGNPTPIATFPGFRLDEPPPEGTKGMHHDEFTLGYERLVGSDWIVGLQGMHREQREILDSALTEDGLFRVENHGRGDSQMPDPIRRYTALEVSARKTSGRLKGVASYTLSRSYGNYVGTFENEGVNAVPHVSVNNEIPEQFGTNEGRLPNDRPHVFEAYGSYEWPVGLTTGAYFTWQSGTPISELGAAEFSSFWFVHVVDRGTVGRTPSIWDLNLRFAYDLTRLGSALPTKGTRLVVDVFHAFSPREVVAVEQRHYFGRDPDTGDLTGVNPNYLRPTAYQAPMTVRVGIEAAF